MKRKLLAVIALAIPGTLAACGGGNAGTGNNPSTSAGTTSTCPTGIQTSGNGATLSIGSKAFAEEELMAQMTADVLGAHGFTITNTFQAKDKAIGTALTTKVIDMYWQYTGTELGDYLGTHRVPDCTGSGIHVRAAEGRGEQTVLGRPDTVRRHQRHRHQVESVRDVRHLACGLRRVPDVTPEHPCVHLVRVPHPARRSSRPREHLRVAVCLALPLPQIAITAEKPIANGQCDAGEVFTTNSGIQANNEVTLTDDKNLFPPDNAGLVVRSDVLQKYPSIGAWMAPVALKLTTPVMIGLNAMVEIQSQTVATVAHTWLVQNGFLSS